MLMLTQRRSRLRLVAIDMAISAALLPINVPASASSDSVIDRQALAQLQDEIRTGQFPNVHSVLVDIHGKRIVEW
jgi:hypothetical protein